MIAKRVPQKFKQVSCYVYYLLLIIGSAIFIRTFIIDIYYVPSSSMERTLFPGDYVLVNKFAYGAVVPQSLREVPVLGSFFKNQNMTFVPQKNRVLTGYKKYNREDIVVFKSVLKNNKLLIKRIVGLPGDTLSIVDGIVHANDTALKELPGYTYFYRENSNNTIKRTFDYSNAELDTLKSKHNLERIISKKNENSSNVFPFTDENRWTRDNYGPLVIPKKGLTVKLTKEPLECYKTILINFEKVEFSQISKNQSYTFKHNYYFMMGDNRQNSQDSRFFGLVPSFFIQGKMCISF